MKPPPVSRGTRRIAREECAVGDWVDAADVPDWAPEMPSHFYFHGRVSISPSQGDLGAVVLSAKPERWLFVARHRDGRPAWIRER